jgi:hypothetical protein
MRKGKENMKTELIYEFYLAVLAGIISAFIAQGAYGILVEEPGFNMIIDKPLITEETSHPLDNWITIANSHIFYKYNKKIYLMALGKNSDHLPEGLSINFNPPYIKIDDKAVTSKITIARGNNIEKGDYAIDIIASGEDGYEKKCSMYLRYI